jgi:formate hydrogenlyase transcriptional activator
VRWTACWFRANDWPGFSPTGTGKGLIARALHELSPCKGRAFVKLNCAVMPTGLLKSAPFDHEKGAFTGAICQKVGRFELAKLLRVLQEQEFERLGSTKTIKVDLRLVAATNRDLARIVADGTFRADLYYRLNVFPVVLPPLQERACSSDSLRSARNRPYTSTL